MNYLQNTFTVITILMSLQTALGVLLHDTNLDQALLSTVKSAYSGKIDLADAKMPETNPHTHPEHAQFSKVLRDNSAHPRTTPRNSDRKHLHQRRVARGQHTFDGYRLIVDNIS